MQKDLNERFEILADTIGDNYALFCICAVEDIAYDPSIEFETLNEYIEKQKRTVFTDGITNIHDLIENGMTDEERWVAEWGVGDKENPYTEDDYKTLDAQFKTYSSRLIANGGMDELQEDTLRYVSRMRLVSDKALAKGGKENISIATQLNKTIQETLAAEQLRKKDERPIDVAKVDGIVEALRKKYGVKADLTMDEAMSIFAEWTQGQKYSVTQDAVEQAIHMIINAQRINEDLPELLPEKIQRFNKDVASQFADETPSEDKVYKYIGLAKDKPRRKK